MILPILESNPPEPRRPWLTLGLLALCAAVFLAARGGLALSGEDERVEISPVIRYVVNADYLEHLLAEYRRLAEEARTGVVTPVDGQASGDESDRDADNDV